MSDMTWTPEQAAAIRSEADTLLVANAGTGKTTTVVGKVLWLLGLDVGRDEATGQPIPRNPHPCDLHEIAAITFTEKAAYDLKRKLRKEIAGSERGEALRWEVDRASVGTIHSFCGSLLRENALRLRIDPTFRVVDQVEARAELDEVIRRKVLQALEEDDPGVGELFRRFGLRGYTNTSGVIDHVRTVVRDLRWHEELYRRWQNSAGAGGPEAGHGGGRDPDRDAGRLSAERLRELCGDWTDGADDDALATCDTLLALACRVRGAWGEHMKAENVRDFDALILDARDLLTGPDGQAALRALRRRYRTLIVDEFQDTDAAQRDIVFELGRGVPRPQLFLVGDPKQSIYRFRGADISVWNEVEREMRHDGRVLPLTRNFRSTPAVIEFANRASRAAIDETGDALEDEAPGSVIGYSDLEAGRPEAHPGAVEWLDTTGSGKAEDRRRREAEAVAGRIQEMVGTETVVDPDTDEVRPCRYRDIAILYRTGTGMHIYEDTLARYRIPYYTAAPPELEARQEVADLLNALRLLDDPRNDLRAFAWLRSPFVGLRDEVVARMRLLDGRGNRGTLLGQARRFLEMRGEAPGFSAPEHPKVAALEREALRRGLEAFDLARALVHRAPLDEVARLLLDRTRYRAHLVVLDEHREALAHLETFLRHLEAHRHLLPGAFLEMWDRRDRADQGLPAAPLHSKEDDVVTFTTMHRAKGLEWPVVFVVDVCNARAPKARTHEWLRDGELGPVLMPKKDERGTRAARLATRHVLEENAESARIFYVTLTRARDRLVVVSDAEGNKGFVDWLRPHRDEKVGVLAPPGPRRNGEPPAPELGWIEWIASGPAPARVIPLERPPLRATTSATELMMKNRDPARWELRYVHGVQPSWEFAPGEPLPDVLESGVGRQGPEPTDADPERRRAKPDEALPGNVRGDVIHGVLERIHEARELARILDETIGELDNPELERVLGPGSEYREALEEEIRRVVESEEWAWYVDGEHYRELPFVHLEHRPWRLGAFDLYRPARRDTGDGVGRGGGARASGGGAAEGDQVEHGRVEDRDGVSWIIDFKTHQVPAERVGEVARTYRLQAEVYKDAGSMVDPAVLRWHFTWPNASV